MADTSSGSSTSRRSLAIAGTIGLLVLALIVYLVNGQRSDAPATDATPAPGETSTATASPVTSASIAPSDSASASYKNGTYQATGRYQSPGGAETLSVSLTITDNTVTAAEVTGNATNPTSRQYQQMFTGGYQAQVVGKKLDEINLDKVSGSSLSPKGFNDAVSQIKTQAKA